MGQLPCLPPRRNRGRAQRLGEHQQHPQRQLAQRFSPDRRAQRNAGQRKLVFGHRKAALVAQQLPRQGGRAVAAGVKFQPQVERLCGHPCCLKRFRKGRRQPGGFKKRRPQPVAHHWQQPAIVRQPGRLQCLHDGRSVAAVRFKARLQRADNRAQ